MYRLFRVFLFYSLNLVGFWWNLIPFPLIFGIYWEYFTMVHCSFCLFDKILFDKNINNLFTTLFLPPPLHFTRQQLLVEPMYIFFLPSPDNNNCCRPLYCKFIVQRNGSPAAPVSLVRTTRRRPSLWGRKKEQLLHLIHDDMTWSSEALVVNRRCGRVQSYGLMWKRKFQWLLSSKTLRATVNCCSWTF